MGNEEPEASGQRDKVIQSQFDAAVKSQRAGNLEHAVQLYGLVVRQEPDFATAWGNMGVALRALGKFDAALRCLVRSVALKPGDAGMVSNLGNAQRAVGNFQAALDVHERAIALDPERGQSHYNSAIVTRDVGNFEAAQAGFEKAIDLGYAPPQLYWDRALCHLMAGDLETGFADYNYRWRLPESPPLHTDIADWDGGDLKGRSLLVYAEQGLGDSIQFIRYLPLLQAKGGRIVLEIQPELKRLVAASAVTDNVEIIERDKKLPAVDIKVPLLTLAHIFKTNLANIPNNVPYLTPPEDGAVARLAIKPAAGNRLTVGINWAGKPTHKNDHNRSIDLASLTALLDIADIRFVSLQKGPRAHDIAHLGLQPLLFNYDGLLQDFADTSALMQGVDLLITVDTSVAHLAGALGRPVWVLIPEVPDWRWMKNRTDSPWYPSMKLYRQEKSGDWGKTIAQIKADLVGFLP